MLSDTSLEEATIAAHRIRELIEAQNVEYQGDFIRTSVSIGITDLHWAECLKQAIDRTDGCLIDAKALGRNSVATTHTTPKPFLMQGTTS
jgi:PleD family two-component response regulator